MNIEQIRSCTVEQLSPNNPELRSSYYQALLRDLKPEQLPVNDEARWLLLCPPTYTDMAIRGPVIGIGPDGWAQVFAQGATAWEEQKQRHLVMLHALYRVVTRLPGVTVWFDPAYLLRELTLFKRRVLLWEVLENRLAEVTQRDALTPGRQFFKADNPGFVCTIIGPNNGLIRFRPNFNGAEVEQQPEATFRALTAINNRSWRLLPGVTGEPTPSGGCGPTGLLGRTFRSLRDTPALSVPYVIRQVLGEGNTARIRYEYRDPDSVLKSGSVPYTQLLNSLDGGFWRLDSDSDVAL